MPRGRKSNNKKESSFEGFSQLNQSSSKDHPLQSDDLRGVLDSVAERLRETSGGSGTSQPKTPNLLDDESLRTLLFQLHDILHVVLNDNDRIHQSMNSLTSQSEALSNKAIDLEKNDRILSDISDHHHQRSLRGKLVISSPTPNFFKQREELEESGESLPAYICSLLYKKYGFTATKEDIYSCHHSRKGIIFRFSNLSPNSLFSQTVSAIRQGHGKDWKEVYFNFALTPKRALLLYELRKAKKVSKIDKLFSDVHGSIFYTLPSLSPNSRERPEKVRITSIFSREEGNMGIKSLSVSELREDLGLDVDNESST